MEDFEMSQEEIEKKYALTILLCAIFGALGIHRFINGKTGSGIAMLLTCGGCGIWVIVDFIVIITGGFKNSNDVVIATKKKSNIINLIAVIILILRYVISVTAFMQI